MDTLKLWEKFKNIPKAPDPLKKAREMVTSGELTEDEVAWAVMSIAMMPIIILKTLEN